MRFAFTSLLSTQHTPSSDVLSIVIDLSGMLSLMDEVKATLMSSNLQQDERSPRILIIENSMYSADINFL